MESRTLSLHQRRAILQSSMLAGVIRAHPKGLPRPRGLAIPKSGPSAQAEEALDFPLERVRDVVDAANTARDRALWTLLGGSGLRTSEALSLRWDHIDIEAQQVFVEDPNNLRWAQDLPLSERLRFKGRSVSTTYIFQPLRTAFFAALLHYLEREYMTASGHDFVFQDVRSGPNRGRPMFTFSDTARNRSFRRAQEKADIISPSGKRYGLHSLRHMYGVYLLNYLPVPGGYGLPMHEVQRSMGHQSRITTEKYVRVKQALLEAKLAFADTELMSQSDEWKALPRTIAQRLHAEANKYEKVAGNE